jgi:two-component system, NarL family, sensor kinase
MAGQSRWRHIFYGESASLKIPLLWGITAMFGVVFACEILTPPDYVMGYFYIIPIVLASSRLNRLATIGFTIVAAVLTLANIWIPGGQIIHMSTVVDRLITVLSLTITGFLSDRNRHINQTVVVQQTKIQAQAELACVREDFSSTLTHDLRTPLLGAIEMLKALQQEQFGSVSPQQHQLLSTIIRSHKTSLQLLQTLLDVYRNDIKGLQLQLSPINLVQIAEEVSNSLIQLAASRRVNLSLSYGESDFRSFLWVNGDAVQLHRVFTNLLTNAINHSPRGTTVEMVLTSQAAYQVVKILDRGAGIQSTEISRLFERFYQGQGDRQASGSGLGLYLSRQIITAHGGTIWAENRLPHGAIFSFHLPAVSLSSP